MLLTILLLIVVNSLKETRHNKGLNAMGAYVLNSTFVLLLNFCAKLNICASNPPLRQAPKRYARLKQK